MSSSVAPPVVVVGEDTLLRSRIAEVGDDVKKIESLLIDLWKADCILAEQDGEEPYAFMELVEIWSQDRSAPEHQISKIYKTATEPEFDFGS